MAQKGVSLDQESFSCLFCLDLMQNPVTIPCGHSYCMDCIKRFWQDVNKDHSCPQCRKTFTPRPALVRNPMLAVLVEELKKSGLGAAPAEHCYAGPEDVACDVCTGRKLKAHKFCLICLVCYCEQHLQPHFKSYAFEFHLLADPSKKLQEKSCSRDEVMKLLCCSHHHLNHGQCICYLCSKLDFQTEATMKFFKTEVLIQYLRTFPSLSPRRFTLSTGSNMGHQSEPTTRAEFLNYAREITLDPDTANTELLLSEGNRRATLTGRHSYRSNPDRFDDWTQVLSRESLTGRCYLEVEWKAEDMDVAVAYKTNLRVGHMEEVGFGYNDRSWCLRCHENKDTVFAYNGVHTYVSGAPPYRIGVYLDHSAGILSFYGVSETMTLLHRVQTTFTQPLYAGLLFSFGDGDTAEFCKLK